MALEITGQIELNGGITIPSAYVRILPYIYVDGKKLKYYIFAFLNKQSYLDNKGNIALEYIVSNQMDYNRDTDGDDILTLIHNKLKAEYETYGLSVEIVDL